MADEPVQFTVHSRSEWRRWLEANHRRFPGVWLVTYKKAAGSRHVPYEDVVQEALAFGWVDSRGRKLDDDRTQLLITPRRPTSNWSRPNKERVERLLRDGLMAPAGLAAVETAKANGSWEALDDVERLIEPDDLKAALDAEPAARANWDRFPRSAKRGILEWILTAKRPETRSKRIQHTADEARAGRRARQ